MRKQEAQPVEQKPKEKGSVGRPPNINVTCEVANVWTSKGKLVRGESASLPASEAEFLIERGQANGKP